MTDEAVIRRRLETASREIEKYTEYDYILVNDQLDDSIDALKAIILTERLRAAGREPSRADEQKLVELAESRRLEHVRPGLGPILESFRKSLSNSQEVRSGSLQRVRQQLPVHS